MNELIKDYTETLERKKRMLERLRKKRGPFDDMTASEAQHATILETEIRMIHEFLINIQVYSTPETE